MNALGYMRLSIRDQSRYSLEYQEKSIREYCERNSLELTTLYKDNGQCSDTFDRPDYKALEAFIKKHKGANRYLIIMDHDRFSRDLSEALSKIKELEKKYAIKVLATNEDIDLDPDDPNIFMQRAFRYLLANEELLRIRKRTKMGMRHALESGRYVGKAPYGYLNVKDVSGKGLIVVDITKAFLVKRIFEEYLDGAQVFVIHRLMKLLGFPSKGHSAIPRVLSNCTYAGLVRVPADGRKPERYVKGVHEAIVSEADYWLAQEKLGNKQPSRSQATERFHLRGLLNCECGARLTAGFSKGKRNYYLYYKCIHHTNVNLPGDNLHRLFMELLDCLSFTSEQLAKVRLKVRKLLQTDLKEKGDTLEAKTAELKSLEQKIEDLEESYFRKDIELSTYKRWFSKYTTEKGHLLRDINDANVKNRSIWHKLEKFLDRLKSIKEVYESASIFDKHKLIRVVFQHNLTFKNTGFETPLINEALYDNYLIANKKGLLFLEQPSLILGVNPVSSP